MASANRDEVEVSRFLRGLVLSIKDCVSKYIACVWDSVIECRSAVVKIPCSVEHEFYDTMSGHFILGDGLLDVSCVMPFLDVLFASLDRYCAR